VIAVRLAASQLNNAVLDEIDRRHGRILMEQKRARRDFVSYARNMRPQRVEYCVQPCGWSIDHQGCLGCLENLWLLIRFESVKHGATPGV
jgi:hypothetical protein